MKRRKLVFLLLVLVMLLVSLEGFATDFNFKFANDQTEDHPMNIAAEYFATRLEEETNGQICTEVFCQGVLGDEQTVVEQASVGAIDFIVVSPSNLSPFVKEIGIFGLPYLFSSWDNVKSVIENDKFFYYIDEAIKDKNLDLKLLGFVPVGFRNLYNRKRLVTKVSDIKGLKIRVMAGPIVARTWEAFGALPTTVAFAEIYTGLQAGVVDGAEHAIAAILGSKMYEVAPFISLTEHQFNMPFILASKKTLNLLSEDLKKIVMKVGKETTQYIYDYDLNNRENLLEELRSKPNVSVVEVDKNDFLNKVKDIHQNIVEDLGCEDIYNIIQHN